jgi:hypothetical protein
VERVLRASPIQGPSVTLKINSCRMEAINGPATSVKKKKKFDGKIKKIGGGRGSQ